MKNKYWKKKSTGDRGRQEMKQRDNAGERQIYRKGEGGRRGMKMTTVWTIIRDGKGIQKKEVEERKSTKRREDVVFHVSLTVHFLVGK